MKKKNWSYSDQRSIENLLRTLGGHFDLEVRSLSMLIYDVLNRKLDGENVYDAGVTLNQSDKAPALTCFKNLIQVLHEIKRTHGLSENLRSVEHLISRFPDSDQNLYRNLTNYLTNNGNYSKFFTEKNENDLKWSLNSNVPRNYFKEWLSKFQKAVDKDEYSTSWRYMSLLDRIMGGLPESGNVKSQLSTLFQDLFHESYMHKSTDITKGLVDKLGIWLNPEPHYVLDSKLNCCFNQGDSRKALLTYILDDAVNLLCTSAIGSVSWQVDLSFGMGIFVVADGYPTATMESSRYLVLEGFPANDKYYKHIQEFKKWERPNYGGTPPSPRGAWPLPHLVYCLALSTAKLLDIPKLFVNTEHSGRQRSVENVVFEAARESKLSADCWEAAGNKSFKFLRDPLKKEGCFDVLIDPGKGKIIYDTEGKPFEYTHFLKKPKFSSGLRKHLNKLKVPCDSLGYFDTWYKWNRFSMDTYKSWSPELCSQHPYATGAYLRGKNPCWNAGIGYCKGFEVDVKKECKRLGIS